MIDPGAPPGVVGTGCDEVHVSAVRDGVLAGAFVHEGDLVDAGDPLARLYPEVSA